MDSLAARHSLSSIWFILFDAVKGRNSPETLAQLQSELRTLETGVTGNKAFNAEVEEFCHSVQSCGLFEKDRSAKSLTSFLKKIEDLRKMLP